MGVTPLARRRPRRARAATAASTTSTPLWYYVLKEAELVEDGLRLGPVGGRIVAEVLHRPASERPCVLPGARTDVDADAARRRIRSFRMTDLLTFAGVDPVSRGQ